MDIPEFPTENLVSAARELLDHPLAMLTTGHCRFIDLVGADYFVERTYRTRGDAA